MPLPARAILFDLDGTLLTTGGAGKRALGQALYEVLGLPDALAHLHLDGMTDRSIVRQAVDAARPRPCAEAEIDAVLERYLEHLARALPTCVEYTVLPGVSALIERWNARGLALGLGTGNVERGARIKLERSGLNPHLRFGGFGCDAEDRAALLAVGLGRASQACGRTLAPGEVWVVGDTPKDIAAARAVGLRVLAVATGRYSEAELAAHGPDAVVATLDQGGVAALCERS
jgi:phosphoglycolate phosphatase-like HAD superfamily hydrolase